MLPLFSLIATSWNIVEKIWAIDSRVHIVAVISSACVQLRQLPLIISFLALTLDRVDISMSLNVFGGSSTNAARSLLPHCFLFSEHSSVGPRAQISSKNPPTNGNAASPGAWEVSRASLKQPRVQIHVHTDASLHSSRLCGASSHVQTIYIDNTALVRLLCVWMWVGVMSNLRISFLFFHLCQNVGLCVICTINHLIKKNPNVLMLRVRKIIDS